MSEASRTAIADAARRLFEEHGFHGTSVADIAREAGVVVQTIYNTVGSKQDVLLLVLDQTVAGERAPTPVPVFMAEAGRAAADGGVVLDQLVDFWKDALPRSAPIQRVIEEAAAVDESMAAFARERAARRLKNYTVAAQVIEEKGALRPGLTPAAAAASIFAIGHPRMYHALVEEGGWSVKRWSAWARDALGAVLLCR